MPALGVCIIPEGKTLLIKSMMASTTIFRWMLDQL